MKTLEEKDKSILASFHNECKNNRLLQRAIREYTEKHGIVIPENIEYIPGIDSVSIYLGEDAVLIIGLPPVSGYPVYETEYTKKYLRPSKAIAV